MTKSLFNTTINSTYNNFLKSIQILNTYSTTEITKAFSIITPSGIICECTPQFLTFKFDEVNVNYLEKAEQTPIIQALLTKLHQIRSFSTSNGKIVYASFNKDKKVKEKALNKKKRAAYELYKKDFSSDINIIPTHLLNKIYCADSLTFLKNLPSNCVDLILTSPPYNFGINYNNSNDSNPWKYYFDTLFAIFRECIRILKPSGRIIINVQPMFSDYIPTHHLISKFFIDEGLIWKGELIWEKNNYNCKYCTWGSWKSPAAPYLKYSWEFIEIFCKNSLKKVGNKEYIDISADEFKKWVYGKWSIAPERKMKQYQHDAMFPEELVKRCIKLFSYKNDIILDPFNGVGTTTKIAKALDRRFIGIDIDPKYCETAKKRLEESQTLFNTLESL